MLNYIKYNCCLVCDSFDNVQNIYIVGQIVSFFFHPDCFEEASGERLVSGRQFTKDQWLDFAGEEYSLAEEHCVEYVNGDKYWHLNGQIHREDGPAIERVGGTKAWYHNGQRHREDGPAVECANGYKEWHLNDKHLTEKEFNKRTTIPK